MRHNHIPINATCPECRGPLSRSAEGVEFHCLVGHVYSVEGLLQAHYETQERTLWSAVVVLEETQSLFEALTPDLNPSQLESLRRHVAVKQEQAKAIRELLRSLQPFPLE